MLCVEGRSPVSYDIDDVEFLALLASELGRYLRLLGYLETDGQAGVSPNQTARRESLEKELAHHRERVHRIVEKSIPTDFPKKDHTKKAGRPAKEFLANMSHELRTPLHAILSYANFGRQEFQTATREELLGYFRHVDEGAQLLLRLVNDLLDLAKMESGKMSFHFDECELSHVVASTVCELYIVAEKRDIRIEFVEPSFECSVKCDQRRISQVVRNVLSNAVKFSPDNGTITVTMNRTFDSIVVRVRDEGPGIPQEEMQQIFEEFFQSRQNKSRTEGTGLGLSICREIMSEHKGRIWAANAPDGGAVVPVEVPPNADLHRESDSNNTVDWDPEKLSCR